MRKASSEPASPQPTKQKYSSLFVVNGLKNTAKYGYAPHKCEECKRPLTWHDRQAAPYADGKYLCAECRAEYMDLHHSDPFCLTGGIAA